jgi:hypothetical protein
LFEEAGVKDGYLLTTSGSERAARSMPMSVGLSRALLAGFLASVAMVVAYLLAFVAALVVGSMPLGPLGEWCRGLTSNALIDVARPNLYAALAVFFAGGLLWAMLYGTVFESRLRGSAWERGALFAMIPCVFSLAVFLPLVGGGFLGMSLGAGPLPILGNFILHLVYGVVLGTVYGPVGSSVLDGPRHAAAGDDVWAGPSSEIGAARGLLVGLALGIVGGLVSVAVLTGAEVLHLNPLSVAIPVALISAAFGGLIGSLSGPIQH